MPCRHTVTFWVVVAGKTEVEDEPSGSIDFWDGATLLGTVPLAPGQETVTEFELLVGTCEITASYSGDAHFARSKSAVEILKVGGWTNTTLTSSCNPSTLGDSVTFTATVTPEARTGLPTGTISFWERHHIRGGYALDKIATATIDSGRANYTTSSLSVGVHDMYASYEGDTDFEESKSGFLMQTVS